MGSRSSKSGGDAGVDSVHQGGTKTTCLGAHWMTSAGQWMSSVTKEEGGMAGNNQYDNPPLWMGGRGSNQYDTGQNRNCDPGAAFLGPRLWDQPINLPFQLFPSDSQQQQQQQDVSKQNIFAQQQHSFSQQQQSCSQENFCSQSFSQQ